MSILLEPLYRGSTGTDCAPGRSLSVHGPQGRAPTWRRLVWSIAGLVGLAALAALPAGAQQPEPAGSPNEYTVKAVFLFNFGRYVQWPGKAFGGATDPFVIGILGADPFGGALDEIAAKKTVHERPIVVRRFASVEEYRGPCHILFVGRSVPGDERAALVKKTEGQGVWLVGESPGFAEQGGMANFFLDGDHVRFEINADNARRAQLRMDAKLLKLGKRVGSPRPAASDEDLPRR